VRNDGSRRGEEVEVGVMWRLERIARKELKLVVKMSSVNRLG
jgi:hypothetical protein